MSEALNVSSSTAQQAYSDLLPRLAALQSISDDKLQDEMRLLKKALMENPAACALMLPQDVGQLVTALRRLTGEQLALAAAKPKGGRGGKQKLLMDAESIASAFDEL